MECIGHKITTTPNHLFHRIYYDTYRIRLRPSRINIARLKNGQEGAILFEITKQTRDMTGQAHFYGLSAYGYLLDDHGAIITTHNVRDRRPYQAILCTCRGGQLPEVSSTEFAVKPTAPRIENVRVSHDTYHQVDPSHHIALTPDLRSCEPDLDDSRMIYTLAHNVRDLDTDRHILIKVTNKHRGKKEPSLSGNGWRRPYMLDGKRLTPKIVAPPTHRMAGKLLYDVSGAYETGPPPQMKPLKRYKLSPHDVVLVGHIFSLANNTVRILVTNIADEETNKVDGRELSPDTGHKGKIGFS